MNNTVKIRKYDEKTSDVTAPSIYERGGFKYILTDIGDVVKIRPGDKMPSTSDIKFTAMISERKYEYETHADTGDVPKGVTPEDERNMKAVEWWKGHPLTTINGKPHKFTTMHLFDVVDETEQVSKSFYEWESKLVIANFAKTADLETLRNICYYYSKSPAGKTRQDLVIDVADYVKGYAMNDISNFLATWITSNSPERDYVVNAQKAVRLGIISNRPAEGRDNYYHGNTYLGSRIEDIIVYFKREEQIYQSGILRDIAERDTFKKEEKSTKEMAGLDSAVTQQMKDDLVARGQQLKKDGFLPELTNLKGMKFEKLKATVEKAEMEAISAKG